MPPPYVAPNELIASAWGNAVVDDLTDLTADTGWLVAAAVAGWSGTVRYRRIGSGVTVVVALTRDGANIAAGVGIGLGVLPTTVRPEVPVSTVAWITGPQGVSQLFIEVDGDVRATGLTINTGGAIGGSLSYEVTL